MAGLQPVGTGLSNLKCPVGYKSDNRNGYCVQNCKQGQSQQNGFCVQTCPTGMALNDQKICIRPTFNRSFYISEKTIENTTVAAVGSFFGGGGALTVGYFNKAERDFVFTNPEILNADSTIVQQQTLTTGTDVPFFVGQDLTVDGEEPAQIVGITNNINSEPTINLRKGATQFLPSSKNKDSIQIPTTIAKVQTNPNNETDSTRQQIRADSASAQNNVIFNATASNEPVAAAEGAAETSFYDFQFDEPAVNVSGNLELFISGAKPTQSGQSNQVSLQSAGFVVDYNSQAQIADNPSSNFDNVQAVAARTFTLNNQIQYNEFLPENAPIQDPSTGKESFNSRTFDGTALNAGQITVGVNDDVFSQSSDKNIAFASALQPSTNDKDITRELEAGQPHPINTQIDSTYNGLTAGNKSREEALQVNHVIGFQRQGAFKSDGSPYLPQQPSLSATDINNYVYLFARGFDSKSPYNYNLQSNPIDGDVVLSQVVEAGWMGRPLRFNNTARNDVEMVGSNSLVKGLWSVTGNLPQSQKPPIKTEPTEPILAVPLKKIDEQTGIVGVGDLQQNSTSDSMIISFCGHAPSSLGPSAAGAVGSHAASDFDQSIQRFPYTGAPQTLTVPANCVNVHFILVGAGGASESEGMGGSGAYIEGDLIANNEPGWWNVGQESQLSIIVGGGGNRDPNRKLQSFGGGGAGQVTGVGQGGGRSAIQSIEPSGSVLLQKDRVVAAGGGGSTGAGKGGNAGSQAHGDLEVSQGTSGWPYVNGGQGANLSLSSSSNQHDIPNGAAGRGGITQGSNYKSNGQPGGFSKGGSSQNQPPGSGALGSGGGGGGYFGGGAASQLGSSDDVNDSAAGGGGGSSQAPSHSVKNLISSAGSGSSGPSMSPLAMKLLANEKVGSGGAFGSAGNHGYVIVILTNRKGVPKVPVTSGNADVASVQYSLKGFDPRVDIPFQGKGIPASKITNQENNPKRAKQLPFQTGQKPQSPIVSVFINNFYAIACEQGPLAENKGFWIASLGSDQPKFTNEFSLPIVVANAHNIRAIRSIDGFTQPSTKGKTKIALIGDGVWIVTISNKKNALSVSDFKKPTLDLVFSGTEEATFNDEPLTDVFSFNDGAYNASDAGEFLISGVPKNITMNMSMHANLLPTFATAVPAPDLMTWGGLGYSSNVQAAGQALAIGTSSNGGANVQGFPAMPGLQVADWVPTLPSDLSNKARYFGAVQDNSVRFATNGLQVVSLGGYLARDATNITSGAPQGNLTIPAGSPFSYYIARAQNGSSFTYFSGMVDWASSETSVISGTSNQGAPGPVMFTNFNGSDFGTNNVNVGDQPPSYTTYPGYTTWLSNLQTSGPLVRSPSTLLVSEDGGSSFNLAMSEYSNLSNPPTIGTLVSPSNSNLKNDVPSSPLTNQVALPLDQCHDLQVDYGQGQTTHAQVQNFQDSRASFGDVSAPPWSQWITNVNSKTISKFTNWYANETASVYNMVSRFQDICFFPDPATKQNPNLTQNKNDVVFQEGQRQVATATIAESLTPFVSPLWRNTEGNVPGFFVAVGCFTWDINMCHFLGGALPISGTVNGTFKPTNAPAGFSIQTATSVGANNTLPINWFQNLGGTSGSPGSNVAQSNGLMNNCIWLLHTSDIDNARAGTSKHAGAGYSFKARPLSSSRANDSFYQCLSVTNMEHQDDTGSSPNNASSPYIIMTTDVGVYRIQYKSIKAAYDADLMNTYNWNSSGTTTSVTYWNPNNFVTAEPVAQNVECRSSMCDACTVIKSDPKNQVNFAGTSELGGEVVPLCTIRYNHTLTPQGGGAPQTFSDTTLDSQGQFNLLNVLGTNGGLLQQQTQQDSSSSGSLGYFLTGDGTTGLSLPNATQSLAAININFNTPNIALSTQAPGNNQQSIQGFTLVDNTQGSQAVINQVGQGPLENVQQIQVGQNTPDALVSGNNINFLFGNTQDTSSSYSVYSSVAKNSNSAIVGPNIVWAQSETQTAVYQGPQTGEDNFNSAQAPNPDGTWTLLAGPTGNRQPTGTLVNGQNQPCQRQYGPIVVPDANGFKSATQFNAPFVWHPFLGLANSWDGQWDSYVAGRASLKQVNVPQSGMVYGVPGSSSGYQLQVGQVDAGGTDLNGLYQTQNLQSDDSTQWFPTQNPKTYANAQLPTETADGNAPPNSGASPITAPFQPSGHSSQFVPIQPNQGGQDVRFLGNQTPNPSDVLSVGITQLFRLGAGATNETTFLTTFDQAQLSNATVTNQMNTTGPSAFSNWPMDPSEEGVTGATYLEFSTLVLNTGGYMQTQYGFATLDLINFYTVNQDPTQAFTGTNQPNLDGSLGSVTSGDISAFYAQQIPLLFGVNAFNSTTDVVSVSFNPSSLQSMSLPMVATNFFRPRNWFFEWPPQPNTCNPSKFDLLYSGGVNGDAGTVYLNDQPCEIIPATQTSPSLYQSEFLYPDPFTTQQGTSSITPATQTTPFFQTLGLTQVKMPLDGDTLTPIILKYSTANLQGSDNYLLNPMVPLDVSNFAQFQQVPHGATPAITSQSTLLATANESVPMANSTAYGIGATVSSCQGFAFPDSSPSNTSNNLATFLAEDAAQVGPNAQSPFYCNTHGVYFSSGTVLPATSNVTASPTSAEQGGSTSSSAVILQFQMDLFVNMSLLWSQSQNSDQPILGFSFANVSDVGANEWMKYSFTRAFLNSLSGENPNQPFNPLAQQQNSYAAGTASGWPTAENLPNFGAFFCNVTDEQTSKIVNTSAGNVFPLIWFLFETFRVPTGPAKGASAPPQPGSGIPGYNNAGGLVTGESAGFNVTQLEVPYFNQVLLSAEPLNDPSLKSNGAFTPYVNLQAPPAINGQSTFYAGTWSGPTSYQTAKVDAPLIPVSGVSTTNGFQNLTFTTPAGASITKPITTALQFIRMSYTIQVPVANDASFYVPTAPDQALPPPGSSQNIASFYGSSKSLTYNSPKIDNFVAQIGPPRGYKGSSDGNKTVPAQGVLIVDAGTGATRQKLITLLQSAVTGSRVSIQQIGKYSSNCGSCTVAGVDPLFPSAKLSMQGGAQVRKYTSIMDVTLGPGLGIYKFDTSNMYADVQLTKRIPSLGPGVSDYVYIVVDLSQGDVKQPLPTSENASCKSDCVLSATGYTYNFALQKKKKQRVKSGPLGKNLGDAPTTPQFDTNNEMFQVDIPFSIVSGVFQNQDQSLPTYVKGSMFLDLPTQIQNQQPAGFNDPTKVILDSSQALPYFFITISGGSAAFDQVDSGQVNFRPNVVPRLVTQYDFTQNSYFFAASSDQPNGPYTGLLNQLSDGSFGQYLQAQANNDNTPISPDEVVLTLTQGGPNYWYGNNYNFFTGGQNIMNQQMYFQWGWQDALNDIGKGNIQNLQGSVRFQYSYNQVPAPGDFPGIFEPTNLQQALWAPNLDLIGSNAVILSPTPSVTQSAMNINTWAVKGANNGAFTAAFNADSNQGSEALLPLPGSNLGVNIATLLKSQTQLLQQPIASTSSNTNSSSLMRNPITNFPTTAGSLIYYSPFEAQVTYQDALPGTVSQEEAAAPVDVPTEFDPSKIYAAGQQVILDDIVQENRGKSNAVAWTLITGDNSNPNPNVIVVQNQPGLLIAVGSEVIGRGIPSGTVVTTQRQDPSIPARKYPIALYITLSQNVTTITAGQTIFTNDINTLSNFDQYFAPKRSLGSSNAARASYEFYKSALAINTKFQATLAYANPQVAFQVVPSSSGEQGTRSGLGPPQASHPNSQNPASKQPFPSTSFTHQQSNYNLVNMQTFHVNPYFNAWTFAYLFNGLKGTEMTNVEGNLKVLPFSSQYTRGTGMIPISFIVAGLSLPGSVGYNDNKVGFPNLQNSEIIYAPNLSKWTFDMTAWQHESESANAWNQLTVAGQNTFVYPNLVRFSIPYMLDMIDAPTTNSRKAGLEYQPLPNNFVCVQVSNAKSTPQVPFGLYVGPKGLTQPQTTYADLLPSNGTNNYELQGSLEASKEQGFLASVEIDGLQPWGSRKNPIMVLTNPMKDIYHNGFNGGFNPVGQGVQHDWPASLLYGDFHLGNGDPASNQSNNGLIVGINPAAVPPSSQRPQLGVAAVQKHQDKVQMKVDFQGKAGLWLNFPNFATQVPPARSFYFDQNPEVAKTSTQAVQTCQYTTPLQNADPKYTLQGRQIKTFDSSNFGTVRADWQGGQVLTNRNQNDFNPSVFGYQEAPDQTRAPLFGWLLTQFSSTNYGEQHQYSNRQEVSTGSLLPSNPTQQTPLSSFNFVPPGVPHNNRVNPGPIHSNNASIGTYPEASGVKGVANENYLMTHQWPENVVTTSLTTEVPLQGTPQSPSFTRFQKDSFNQPTTDDPGWQYNFPTGPSQSYRFDGGAVLNKDPDTTPQRSSLGGPSCTSGVSIWLDASLGDTICIHQNLLRPMTTVARPSTNGSPSLPGGLTMTSWPGVTDVGMGRIWDGGSSNPDGIQNFVPEFVPDVPLVNQPFEEINQGKPVEMEAHRSGQGAQGTNDGDDPYVICCQFSDSPDFGTTPKEQGLGDPNPIPTNCVYSLSQSLTNSSATQSNQSCVDIYQVFPPAPYSMQVFNTSPNAVTVINAALSYLGYASLGQGSGGSLLPLAMIPDTGNTTTGYAPQTIPDFSGLGLSLMSQNPDTFGKAETLFTGTKGLLVPAASQGYAWSTDPIQVELAAANTPIFPQNSPFFKYANLQQPINAWTADLTTSSTNVNTPFLFLNNEDPSQTTSLGNAQGLPNLLVGNPSQKPSDVTNPLNNCWNQAVATASGAAPGSIVLTGGLTAYPLRAFPVTETSTGTSGDFQVAPTCIGTNPTLTALNRCVIGVSNGTLRLFDQVTNQTISSTSLSNFYIVNSAGGNLPVNVSYITQLVWFEKKWFAATNYGIFYTAIDPRVAILAGNTERNIEYFYASELTFVLLPVGSPQTNNGSLPPCTMLKKIRNNKRSYLVASFPDYAQGYFATQNVFPQMSAEFPVTDTDVMTLPLNSGNSLPTAGVQTNSNFSSVGPNVVCQSLQLIARVSKRNSLNQFKVVSKFTGVPTVGGNPSNSSGGTPLLWSLPSSGRPFLTNATNAPPNFSTFQPSFLPYINSNVTDILKVGNRVLYSCMQVPQKISPSPAPSQLQYNPNLQTQVYSMAQGSFQALMTFKNDILAPTPYKNAFSSAEGTNLFSLEDQPPSVQGDSSLRIAQCITVSNTLPNTLYPNKNINGISAFLKTFFNGLQNNLQKAGQVYVPSQSSSDPHLWDTGLGQASTLAGVTVGLPLENILLYAQPTPDEYGLQKGALGVFVVSPPQTNPNSKAINIAPSYVATIETDLFMQAFWGFNQNTMVQFGIQAPNGQGSVSLFPDDLISGASVPFQEASAAAGFANTITNTYGFTFFGNQATSQFNSAIMYWSTTSSVRPKFSPKLQTPDSALSQNAADGTTDDGKVPLSERIFESIQVSRMNLVWANDTIGDFTQAPDLKGGILAWTVSGPQSALPIAMSGANVNNVGILENGVVNPNQIQNPEISDKSDVTGDIYKAPMYGLPAIATNALLAQNPQTNEFWGAGIGYGVDDQSYMETQVASNPLTEIYSKFVPYKRREQRFMIVRNPGARGTDFADKFTQPNGGGVPSAATDLLPSTLNWVEEVNILPNKVSSGNALKYPVTLLSQSFEQKGVGVVTAIEFSQNATVIAGYTTSAGEPTTSLWQKNNEDIFWGQGNLQVPGRITAIKFVNFGWQIAVAYNVSLTKQASSLYFASANFSVITIVDTWGPMQTGVEVNSFAQTVRPNTQPCDAAAGFEPNPVNPRTCLKKCPHGQEAVGDLCALNCPAALGFKTTLVPNECLPLKQKPKKVPGVGPNTGGRPLSNEQKPVTDFIEEPSPIVNVRGGLIGIAVAVFLIAFIIQIVYMFRFYKITKPNF